MEVLTHYLNTYLFFINFTHNSCVYTVCFAASDMRSCLAEAAETRAALLELFQGLLFGDSLAAEYLLCHLISTV